LIAAGFQSTPATLEGWSELSNGRLAKAAMIAGYDGIITRDVRMHLDAAHVLKDLPKFAIVIVQLAQAKKAVYLAAFEEALRRTPLVPQPGQVLLWPKVEDHTFK